MIIRLVKCKFLEEAIQTDEIDQISEEYIEIVDSADVQVTTTDTKVAIYPSGITSDYRSCSKYFYSR